MDPKTAMADSVDRPSDILYLYAYFRTTTHFVRREYMLYGFDSFVADVGGYLGLLLGHSLLSIFYKTADWYEKASKR